VPAEAAREEAPVEAPAELAVEAEPASDATSAGREN